jgi:hypothetical protein
MCATHAPCLARRERLQGHIERWQELASAGFSVQWAKTPHPRTRHCSGGLAPYACTVLSTLRTTTNTITAAMAPQMISMRLLAYRLRLDEVGTAPFSGFVSSMEGFLGVVAHFGAVWCPRTWVSQPKLRRTWPCRRRKSVC